jgi:hypothetical protein
MHAARARVSTGTAGGHRFCDVLALAAGYGCELDPRPCRALREQHRLTFG